MRTALTCLVALCLGIAVPAIAPPLGTGLATLTAQLDRSPEARR